MAHTLYNLRSKVFNTPQLMQFDKFESVVQYINARCDGSVEHGSSEEKRDNGRYSYNDDLKVAVMNIEGPLTYRPVTFMGMDCGGANYQTIKSDFEELVERGAKTIAFYSDSPGGEAFQLFPTAKYLRKLADENQVKIVTYVDGLAASAMYGLAAISDEIVAAPGAETGSIGVVVRLLNDSQALEKAGYQRTFVKAGASKVAFEEDGSFRKEFIADVQAKVDELYEEFVQHVAEYRNISAEAVRNTEAKTFTPEQAIEIGLVDSVLSVEEFYDYLALVAQSNLEESDMSNPLKDMFKLNKKEDKAEMSQLTELQALLETKEAELSASLDQIATMSAHMADMKDQLESLQSFAQAQKDAAEAAQAEAARIAEEQAQAKIAQRKASLSAVLAEDKVEATFEALASLEDSAFELVVAQYAAAKEALAESFKALGGEGVELEDTTTSEQGSVNAIRQAGVESARKRFSKSK